MRPHHIGYLVDDVENAAQALERLGYRRRGEATRDDGREIFILFLENGGLTVELIKPDGRESPYYGLRKTFRNAPYHMGYAVADLGRAIDKMVNCGNPGGTCYSNRPPRRLRYPAAQTWPF